MKSPWLTTAEIAERLRFVKPGGAPDLVATKRFLDRHHVPTKYRGRMVLAHIDEVDGALVQRTDGRPARAVRRTPATRSLRRSA
jgi:hypothetical protein